jgi:hypothetical protein
MAGPNPSPFRVLRRSLFGGLRPLLLIVLIGGGLIGIMAGLLYLTAPDWTKSRSGHPALTGHWGGTMAYHGTERTIVFSLKHSTGQVGNSGATGDNGVYGAAKVCGPRGTFTDDLSGGVFDRADHIRLVFDWDPKGAGWHPSGLRATWDHQNHLAATTTLYLERRDGSTATSDVNKVVHFDLHRISDDAFDAGCSS